MFQASVEILIIVLWISSSKPVFSSKIVGKHENPREMKYSDFPFYVQVLKLTKATEAWHYLCGGTLIASSVTLTACHCVSSPEGKNTRVYLDLRNDALVIVGGAENPWYGSPNKQETYVKQIMAHPHCAESGYNTTTWDVAVLLHFRPFQNTAQVQPLGLYSTDPRKNLDELVALMALKEKCHVIGNVPYSKDEQTIEIEEMIPQYGEDCRKQACKRQNDFLCNHQYTDAGQVCMKPAADHCISAAGGPIYCKGYLFGVVSWPEGCAVGGFSVDANVVAATHVTNWYSDGLRRSAPNSASTIVGAYSLLLPTTLLLKTHGSIGF